MHLFVTSNLSKDNSALLRKCRDLAKNDKLKQASERNVFLFQSALASVLPIDLLVTILPCLLLIPGRFCEDNTL